LELWSLELSDAWGHDVGAGDAKPTLPEEVSFPFPHPKISRASAMDTSGSLYDMLL